MTSKQDNHTAMFFVYVRYNGILYAQLWYSEQTDGNGKPRYSAEQVVFKKKLSEEEKKLSFEQLKRKFPAPEIKD